MASGNETQGQQSNGGLLSGVSNVLGGVVGMKPVFGLDITRLSDSYIGTAGNVVGGVTNTLGETVRTVGDGTGKTLQSATSGLGDATSKSPRLCLSS